MWYRVTVRLANHEMRRGIRHLRARNDWKAEMIFVEKAQKAFGRRVDAVLIEVLHESDPEVQAFLSENTKVRYLE